ncbi:MAG: peptide chain release factor aRF-1 [Methanomicrobiales archaeon]|nr:peptide chain release factor aRF-1 [Methanomicrobiales archaeon]
MTERSGEIPDPDDFAAALEKLEPVTGNGADLITLYIPPDKPVYEVTGFLKEEYAKTDSIRYRETRKHVQNALSSVLSHLKNYERLPPRGIAIFCGKDRLTDEGTDLPCTVIEPVEPLAIYLYRCSSLYDLEPLKQMLAARNVYGLLVLDVREAYWGFLRGNHVEPAGSATSSVPGKQRKGGQSAARFQRLRDIAVDEFFTRVGEHAGSTFHAERDFFKRFKGVLVGGRGPAREHFLAGNYLHHEIRQKVIGAFEVTHTGNEGLHELVRNARDVIQGMDIAQQQVMMDRFYADLGSGSGLAAYGEESIRKNLALGAVGTLLLSATLRKNRFQITCQDCGHTEERTFQLDPETSVPEILAHTCRVCSAPILEDETVDLIEELTRLADRIHAKTVIISADFDAGALFFQSYGGIGALLRYRTEQ